MTAAAPAASRPHAAAVPASVTCWGELAAERPVRGVLHVLVGGEHAGAVERAADGQWVASWYAGLTRSGMLRGRVSAHASAEDAVRAVLRSAWSRRLGGRAASPVHWSDRARRAASRQASR
jgi:hypothetical protein